MKFGVLILLLVASQIASARVLSVSTAHKAPSDVGELAYRIKVTCDRGDRVLLRQEGSAQWCDSKINEMCSNNKLKVAKSVCGRGYATRLERQEGGLDSNLASAKPVQQISNVSNEPQSKDTKFVSEEVALARQELLTIEQQRVKIRARELELRKQELELKKAQLSTANPGY